MERKDEEVQVKAINVALPLKLHKEFRKVAEQEGMTGTALLRKLIVSHLDEAKK